MDSDNDQPLTKPPLFFARLEQPKAAVTVVENKPAGKGKKSDGKKQMSLSAMLKQPSKTAAAKNKKTDTIVRLYNSRGFHAVSSWVARLLDLDIVEFRGTMVDCPQKLTTGCNFVISVAVHMLPTAFKPSNIDTSDKPPVMFSEGAETLDEQLLRERKASIIKLFDELNLRPDAGANSSWGDGEEIEVEEGEEITDNDLGGYLPKGAEERPHDGRDGTAGHVLADVARIPEAGAEWMSSIELGKMDARQAASTHPLWSRYLFPLPPVDGIIDLTADQKPFYFNPYSGELSLDFPKAERQGRGGILACRAKKSSKAPSATLIVAPTSLLAQWESELQRCSKPGTLECVIWHGQNRQDLQAMLDDDDDSDDGVTKIKVVITSYGVLASEHAKLDKSKSPLYEVEWLRVVLDEAHACKSRTSKTAKAVYALTARRRWAVTGTPIVNKLEDLYSLLKFLDFRPWADFSFFRSFITLPFLARDTKALEIVQIILESILLRREKTMLDTNGKRIVELPPKEVVIEHLEFSSLERKIYDSLFNSAKRDFLRLDAKGLVGKNYTHILAMLMRLRRAVLHPNLVLSNKDNPIKQTQGDETVDVNELIKRFANDDASVDGGANVFAQKVLENLDIEEDDAECPVCLDVMQSPMVIPDCMHRCCKDCLMTLCATAEEKGKDAVCPTCSRGPIEERDLMEVFRPPKSSQNPEPAAILRKNDFRSSTKLEALIQNLRKLREQDPCFRAVVFSQFTSFLDLIQIILKREHFEHYRFDGSMDVKTRGAAIEQFKAPARKAKILVVSLKAGGVGLNLTTANHVFMMDCWWNAAIENQAIDRVHRIGQEKTVYVKHFIVANTIEGRIQQIQKRKLWTGIQTSGPTRFETSWEGSSATMASPSPRPQSAFESTPSPLVLERGTGFEHRRRCDFLRTLFASLPPTSMSPVDVGSNGLPPRVPPPLASGTTAEQPECQDGRRAWWTPMQLVLLTIFLPATGPTPATQPHPLTRHLHHTYTHNQRPRSAERPNETISTDQNPATTPSCSTSRVLSFLPDSSRDEHQL
ncbi:DNA repair protein [Mycena chlorophos]|uniref:DNA repair protein n=1 Tax=Mycena chlorophos TaxID=658473 RepID=A0A8H6T457_MYCCL|nr:DNA repair protein [Mycena chlorophos]